MQRFVLWSAVGFLAAGPCPGATNAVAPPPSSSQGPAAAVHPVEQAYERLLEEDDAAQDEVDRWIREDAANREKTGGDGDLTLKARVKQRLESVRKAYEEFLQRHPDHARARLAYGSFLGDIGEEDTAVEQMERARQMDPKNPAAWNNLANHYGHRGPVQKAFEYYAKAIELNPRESVYYQNLATVVFMFRPDATNFYRCTEPEVFDRSLGLYRQAMALAPTNFVLASDYAMSFYGIKPLRANEARQAWRTALSIASDAAQREGVQLHLARIAILAGEFEAARQHLEEVKEPAYADLKRRVARNLEEREAQARTNAPAAPAPKP